MRVRRIVDLSLRLDAGTQVYPGDPDVLVTPHATIARDGFNLAALSMGSQSGTNCDAPLHFDEAGAPIDEVALELFAGPGLVIDVRHRRDRDAVTVADIEPWLDRCAPGVLVLLHTGWSRYYGTPRYFDHPFLGAEACASLLGRGVRTICLDTLNIDETPDEQHPGVGFPCHHLVAEVGGIVVENLTALDQIDFADPFVTAFPLKLTGVDGSTTRAVALQLEP